VQRPVPLLAATRGLGFRNRFRLFLANRARTARGPGGFSLDVLRYKTLGWRLQIRRGAAESRGLRRHRDR
jgi:hypothetical protein